MNDSGNERGTTKVNRRFFEELRERERWTYKEVASRAGVSSLTIWRITKGKSIRTVNARRIANAFGVNHKSLITGVDPPIPPKQTQVPRYEITIRVGVDYLEMSHERRRETEILLSKVIGANSKPTIIDVKAGSAIVSLKMTRGDVLRLLAAMVDHELDLLRVEAIKLNNYTWLKIMLAMLEVDNGEWKDLNDRDLSNYIWYRPFSKLMIQTKNCKFCKGME